MGCVRAVSDVGAKETETPNNSVLFTGTVVSMASSVLVSAIVSVTQTFEGVKL